MSESRGRDLKPPVDDIFYEILGFWTFFRYHNFQNEIDAWESTVSWTIILLAQALLVSWKKWRGEEVTDFCEVTKLKQVTKLDSPK